MDGVETDPINRVTTSDGKPDVVRRRAFCCAHAQRPAFSSCRSCPSDSAVAGYTSGGSFGNLESVTRQPPRDLETGINNRSPALGFVACKLDRARRSSETAPFQDFSTRTVSALGSSTTAVNTSVAERTCSRFSVIGFALRNESTPSPINHKPAKAAASANRCLADDASRGAVLSGESVRTSRSL